MIPTRSLLAGLAILGLAAAADAAVVFEDDFTARPNNEEIFGTSPATAGQGVGTYGAVLTFPFAARVDPFTPLGKLLKFDTSVGDDTQMIYLPAPYTVGSEIVRLSITAAHNQAEGFNNFAVGFAAPSLADGHNVFAEHVLIQTGQIQFNFPGVDTFSSVPFSATANTLYTFELSYDPGSAGQGDQPWSFRIDGVDVPIPVEPTTVYEPLTHFDYVAFGGRFSGGLTTRFIRELRLETAVPEPGGVAAALAAWTAVAWLGRRRVVRCCVGSEA